MPVELKIGRKLFMKLYTIRYYDKRDTFHYAAAKHIQGLLANTSNYGSIVTAG